MGKEKVTVNDLKVTLSELGVTSGLKQEKIIQRLQVNGCLIAMVTDVLDQLIKDEEECWQEMQKHQPFGWMIPIGINQKINLTVIGNGCDLEALFKKFTFADGTPFGVKVE